MKKTQVGSKTLEKKFNEYLTKNFAKKLKEYEDFIGSRLSTSERFLFAKKLKEVFIRSELGLSEWVDFSALIEPIEPKLIAKIMEKKK